MVNPNPLYELGPAPPRKGITESVNLMVLFHSSTICYGVSPVKIVGLPVPPNTSLSKK